MSVVYVACDHGARAAVKPLLSYVPGKTLLGVTQADERYWQSMLQDARLLICGTSDTSRGRTTEAQARIAANALDVPCVVIEDFPGNYVEVPDGRPRLLFVESEFAARLARGKSGGGLSVQVCPSVRYDALRRELDVIRSRQKSSLQLAVLWVGQPETADSLETLKRVLPALAARGATLWFRAHPRDQGYAHGAYEGLLKCAGLVVEDLTSRPLAEILLRRPALVATQFSSVAIEAGFWGTCALNVLFADVGGRTLAAKKGYAVPPWCEEGAAFLIVRQADVEKILDIALFSSESRAQVMRAFDRYFRVHEDGSQQLINVLYNQRFL